MKKERGITLIALVITIIILLILSGVMISLLLGNNGILNKATNASEEYTKASIKEEIERAITDITIDLMTKTPPETLSNDALINYLQDKLIETVSIDSSLTGNYKGYEYWIDDKYKVHIGNKYDSLMELKVVPTVGTSYIKLNVIANSTQGAIIGYIYVIDGIETSQKIENIYTIENLEPESTHTIKVIAIDEKGNKKENQRTIKTESRVYLYQNGEETNIGEKFEVFNQFNATISLIRRENSIDLNTSCSSPVNWMRGLAKKVNLTGYSKVAIHVTNANIGICNFGIGNYKDDLGGKYLFLENYELIENGTEKTYMLSVDNISKETYVALVARGQNTTNITFDAMWLEK